MNCSDNMLIWFNDVKCITHSIYIYIQGTWQQEEKHTSSFQRQCVCVCVREQEGLGVMFKDTWTLISCFETPASDLPITDVHGSTRGDLPMGVAPHFIVIHRLVLSVWIKVVRK